METIRGNRATSWDTERTVRSNPITALLLAWRGAYDRTTLLMILIALPSTMIAAQIGLHVFGRLSTDLFRRFLIGLTFVSGSILMARELWALGAG